MILVLVEFESFVVAFVISNLSFYVINVSCEQVAIEKRLKLLFPNLEFVDKRRA